METFETVAVAAIAVLPGALYVWGFEREVGNWGIGLSDRLVRFFGTSAFFHAAVAPFSYWIWANFIVTKDVASGHALPLSLWALVAGYAAVPFSLRTVVGRATRGGRGWTRVFTGPNPAPRAWDHFFSNRPDGWIRLRLKSGIWLAGAFARANEGIDSYAAGYPEPQDLFLAEAVEVDAESGAFVLQDGQPVFRGNSLLIRWDEVEFLEFSDA